MRIQDHEARIAELADRSIWDKVTSPGVVRRAIEWHQRQIEHKKADRAQGFQE